MDNQTSTIYAGWGDERGDGVYTTDIASFQNSDAMKIIKENDWHVLIREVPLSNKVLHAAKEKLEASAEKFGVTNVMLGGAANTLVVETSDLSSSNVQAIEKFLGLPEILAHAPFPIQS